MPRIAPSLRVEPKCGVCHDTGLVTLISQDLSEFALHARAILGLPIPNIAQHGPSASAVILVEGHSEKVAFANLGEALAAPDTQLRLFGKPFVKGKRRMGVAVARGATLEEARATGDLSADKDPRALARLLVAGIYGLRVYNRTRPGRKALSSVVDGLLSILD